ncbi:M56 family metallopeptidase [Moorella sp. Hama-1]|uniref:M56 family metallopeptidase n=1 Tax=Moorella sp. Hama-1 TaxID=2138101 RepID=UPI000D6524EC
MLEACKRKLNLQAEVAIIFDHSLKSPALYGLIRPKILLSPAVTSRLAPEELQYVFIHELTHLKRKDLWLNTAVMLLQVIILV